MQKEEIIELFENQLVQLEKKSDFSQTYNQLIYYIFDDFRDYNEDFMKILFAKNNLYIPNLFDLLNSLALKKDKSINSLIENRLIDKIKIILEESEEKDIAFVMEVIRKWIKKSDLFNNDVLNQIEQIYQEKLSNCENLLLKNYLETSTVVFKEKESDHCRRCLYMSYNEWVKANKA